MNGEIKSEETIFAAAIDLAEERRAAYLSEACAGDDELLRRVEALLNSHNNAETFLETPPAQLEAFESVLPVNDLAGRKVGRYKLLEKIGEGGCGVVYMASQNEPIRREVAVKIIKLGMDTRNVVARFEAERQALAILDHPNIAKVLDAGATVSGRPYFVMELVRGVKITEFCDSHNLSTRERLELFIQVCGAIQHAHQKGIIHRDIKPSNILVTLNDGVPLPKVIDFGIAKATQEPLTDKTLFTAFEQFLGTPAYMSPEQAEMNAQGVDTRSDIYSLGVLLYELLTGRTPFPSDRLFRAGVDEIRRIIREEEPATPSTMLQTMANGDLTSTAMRRQTDVPKLVRTIRGELDWIVLKALEKDRTRRYETAERLARDVARHLADEPVAACPPDKWYLLAKAARRHKTAVTAAAAFVGVLILGLCGTLVAVVRIQSAREAEARATRVATDRLWNSSLAEAAALSSSHQAGQKEKSLAAILTAASIRVTDEVRDEAIAALALTDVKLGTPGYYSLSNWVLERRRAECSPDGSRYVLLDEPANVTIRAVFGDRPMLSIPRGTNRLFAARFTPDGSRALFWESPDGEHRAVSLWDVDHGKELLSHVPAGYSDAFSDDGSRLAVGAPNGGVMIFDTATGKEILRVSAGQDFNNLALAHENELLSGLSRDGRVLYIFELRSGGLLRSIKLGYGADCVAWDCAGKWLAIGGRDNRVHLMDRATFEERLALEGHFAPVVALAFNHAGSVLASGSWDGSVRLWLPDTGEQLVSIKATFQSLAFTADDRQLGVVAVDRHFRMLDIDVTPVYHRLHIDSAEHYAVAPSFSPDNQLLAVATDNSILLWNAETGKSEARFAVSNYCEGLVFSPDGGSLFVSERGVGLVKRPLVRKKPGWELGEPETVYASPELREVAIDRSGRHLAVADYGAGEAVVVDPASPSNVVHLRTHKNADYIAISPDGHWVGTGSWQNTEAKIWNVAAGGLDRSFAMPSRARVAFAPDSASYVLISTDYQTWKTNGTAGSWRQGGDWIQQVNRMAFSRNGRFAAYVHDFNRIAIMDSASHRVLYNIRAPGSALAFSAIALDADGKRLAAVESGGELQLWDLRALRAKVAALGLDWNDSPDSVPPMAANK